MAKQGKERRKGEFRSRGLETVEFTGAKGTTCACAVGGGMCLDGCFSISCTGSKVVESYIRTGFRNLENPAEYQLESNTGKDDLAIARLGIPESALERQKLIPTACLCSLGGDICTSACNSMSCFGTEVVESYLIRGK